MNRPRPTPQKLAEWQARAAAKNAIVPEYFEVFPNRVIIECGRCGREFRRNLVPNIDEPVFVCPDKSCKARNWLPVRYDLR
ncbi:MAG: hypothetical protein D6719_05155 [Candidatus Dadabacteria bacterium]|nr:MAG: hypothetical protein D6719_05155 [Candidatus Dadabacteria bacterium]